MNRMDNREAKFILQAYRPDGQDAADPEFREALEQAERDPELSAWLHDERAFDEAFAAKLNKSSIPPGLKEDILVGKKVIPMPSFWHRPTSLVAMAASFALVLGVIFFAMFPPSWDDKLALSSFRDGAIGFYEGKDFRLKMMSDHTEDIRAWLAQNDAPNNFVIPEGMRRKTPLGCTTFDLKGKEVSLVCFRAGNTVAHLFMIDRNALENPPPKDPSFERMGDWSTAVYSKGNLAFMVAAKLPMPEVQGLFAGAPIAMLRAFVAQP